MNDQLLAPLFPTTTPSYTDFHRQLLDHVLKQLGVPFAILTGDDGRKSFVAYPRVFRQQLLIHDARLDRSLPGRDVP